MTVLPITLKCHQLLLLSGDISVLWYRPATQHVSYSYEQISLNFNRLRDFSFLTGDCPAHNTEMPPETGDISVLWHRPATQCFCKFLLVKYFRFQTFLKRFVFIFKLVTVLPITLKCHQLLLKSGDISVLWHRPATQHLFQVFINEMISI